MNDTLLKEEMTILSPVMNARIVYCKLYCLNLTLNELIMVAVVETIIIRLREYLHRSAEF